MKSRPTDPVASPPDARTKTIGVALFVALVTLLAARAAWAYWTFRDEPLQQAHLAIATVVAIAPTFGRSDRQTIIVRNAHGVGQVSTLIGATHCNVGDKVPVIQRGTTLSPAPTTCK